MFFLLISLIVHVDMNNESQTFDSIHDVESDQNSSEFSEHLLIGKRGELEHLGIVYFTREEGYDIIGDQESSKTLAEIVEEKKRRRENFIEKPKESYSRYAKQVEECEKYIISIYQYGKNEEVNPSIRFQSVEHRDNGTTIFRFGFGLGSIAFIYNEDEKCIGYVLSRGMIQF